MKNTPVKPKTEQPQQRPGSLSRKVGAAACAATLAGCASAPVRHLPPPAECPRGSVEFVDSHRLEGALSVLLPIQNHDYNTPIQVKEGPIEFRINKEWSKESRALKLPGGAVTGQLFFGPDGRVYGRFYSLRSRDGDVYPFCGKIQDYGDNQDGAKATGEITDTARIGPWVFAVPVDSFE